MFSLESFYKEYETETTELVVNGHKFNILLPKDLFQFIKTGIWNINHTRMNLNFS